MYPLVFFVTCFNLLYVLLLDTFLKCLILHRKNAPHWRVCTNLKMKKQIKVIFKNVKTSEWVMSPSEPGEGSSCRSCALSVSQRLRGGSHLGRVQHKTTNKNAQTQYRFFFFVFFFKVPEVRGSQGLWRVIGLMVARRQTAAVKMSALWCDGHCF